MSIFILWTICFFILPTDAHLESPIDHQDGHGNAYPSRCPICPTSMDCKVNHLTFTSSGINDPSRLPLPAGPTSFNNPSDGRILYKNPITTLPSASHFVIKTDYLLQLPEFSSSSNFVIPPPHPTSSPLKNNGKKNQSKHSRNM
jgi:hypothetical protein